MSDYDTDLLRADMSAPKFTLKTRDIQAKCIDICDGNTAYFAFKLGLDWPVCRYKCKINGYDVANSKSVIECVRGQAITAKTALGDKIMNEIVTLNIIDIDRCGALNVTISHEGTDIAEWMIAGRHNASCTCRGFC